MKSLSPHGFSETASGPLAPVLSTPYDAIAWSVNGAWDLLEKRAREQLQASQGAELDRVLSGLNRASSHLKPLPL